MRAVQQQKEQDSPDGHVNEPVSARESEPTSRTQPAAKLRTAASNTNPQQSASTQIDNRNLIIESQSVIIRLITQALDQDSFEASMSALAGELQHRFRSDRVAIGLMHNDGMRIHAISQQASVDSFSGEVRLLSGAMQEACEQDQTIHYPIHKKSLLITAAHQALAAGRPSAQVCTLPLCHHEQIVGAVLFDIDSTQRWSNLTVTLMRQASDIIAPLILIRKQAESGIMEVVRDRIRHALESLVKPKYLAAKCIGILLCIACLAAYIIPVTHEIKASVEIVPLERRMITAPHRGYIKHVSANSGDQIVAGQVILTLDTRELELERVNRENEIRSVKTELRAAMANHDRKAMALANARLDQATAQYELIHQKINRSSLLSPTEGTVVSGDLSQSLGAPVERGETLFVIAPSAGYKAKLMVAESEVGYINKGQPGHLTLKSNPGTALAITVNKIHPMAEAANGSNRFRVEATLDQNNDDIRPGQTGVGKLYAEEKNLLWVITHRFTQWLRLHLWEWFG